MKRVAVRNDYPFIRDDDPEDFKRFAMSNAIMIRVMAAQSAKQYRLYQMNNVRLVQKALQPAINAHLRRWTGCQACPLGQHPCVHSHVFFRGLVKCDILFIGDAPGDSEDTIGMPFVGPAGHRFNEIIERAALEVYPNGINDFIWCVTNTVCCYPMDAIGKKREPNKKEILECLPRLIEFVEICQPTAIITVGAIAEKHVPRWPGYKYYTIKHPSWIERKANEEEKELETERASLEVQKAIRELIPF